MNKERVIKWTGKVKDDFFENTNYKNIYATIFNHAVDFENKFSKDLSAFNQDEAKEYLCSFNCSNHDTLGAYASLIRKYNEYCMENKVPGASNEVWSKINLNFIKENCLADTEEVQYITPEMLDNVLEMLPNPCDQFLVLGLYEGLYGFNLEDIWKLSIDDIDENNKTMSLPSGRTIKVSQKLIDLAKASNDTYTYESIAGEQTRKLELDKECPYVFKHRPNARTPYNSSSAMTRLTSRMVNIRNYTGLPWVTVPKLNNSGLIEDIKALMKEKNVSLKELIYSDDFDELREKHHNKRLGYQLVAEIEKYV